MKINWIVRIRNKTFWMLAIPALAVLVVSVLNVFNIQLNLDDMVEKLLKVVTAVFALLSILGVAVDPTTDGVGDSNRAMTYVDPWKDEAEAATHVDKE